MTDPGKRTTASPKRIFVSYSSPDREWARWMATSLRDSGHSVTVQADDFLPGRNFVVEMRRALAGIDHVVAVLSPAYEESGFALAEWADAFAGDPTGLDRRLIGVRVADYQPGPLMRASIYADLCGVSQAEAERRLLAAINPHEHPPGPAPFPGRANGPSDLSGRPPVPPNCVWRHDEVIRLKEALASGHRAAITGLGGIGKTSLATRLLDEVLEDYDAVVWMRAGDRRELEPAAVRAAIALEIVAEEASPEEALAALRVTATPGWLVVVDDCPDGASISQLLPNATILATSRNDRGWSPTGFYQLRLDPWTAEEVVRFLSTSAPSAVEVGEELTQRLGGLPLAIAQAAAYIDASGLSGTEYLLRLDGYATEVFSEPLDKVYGRTILSAWAMALDDLRRDDLYAAQLLDVAAFLARDQIPLDLVRSIASMPEPFATGRLSAVSTDRALAALLRQSLCAVAHGSLAVHPLIQSVVGSRLGRDEAAATLAAVIGGLSAAAPESTKTDAWFEWEQLGPHILAAFGALRSFDLALVAIRPLATSLAEALTERGFPHVAIGLRVEVLEYILRHREKFAPNDVGAAAHDLGNSYAAVQMSDAAAHTYRLALQIDDLLGQRESTRSLASRVGLVGALTDTGEHDEAAQVIAEAADCWERLYQYDRELGIMIFGTWGRLLTRTSEPGSARPHLQTALRLAEEAGKQSEIAITLLHLGNADLEENNIDSAREHFESGLAIAAAIPNAHHLRASIMQNLCSIDLQISRPADAHALATEALAELAHLPESEFSVIAALLHFTRAQADLSSGGDLKAIVAEAGAALEVLSAHLPPGHRHREQLSAFLLRIADRIQDDRLRAAVESLRHRQLGSED